VSDYINILFSLFFLISDPYRKIPCFYIFKDFLQGKISPRSFFGFCPAIRKVKTDFITRVIQYLYLNNSANLTFPYCTHILRL